MALSKKQQVFIDEYLQCWNATEAARRAGYSERSARSIGAENLTKPDIAEAISQRLRESAMSADEVLMRLAAQARGDIANFITMTPEGFKIDLKKAVDDGLSHLVKRVGYNKHGKPEIELYDAQAALVHLGRHHKLFTDRVEAEVEVEVDDPRDELLSRITRLATRGAAATGNPGDDAGAGAGAAL
jgi:phage terminase small subunit